MSRESLPFPNTIGLPFGEGCEVRLGRGQDASFTAELDLIGPYGRTETDQRAHRSPDGVMTGSPELVGAFPGLMRQRDAFLNHFIAEKVRIFRLQELGREIQGATREFVEDVVEQVKSLAARGLEAEAAGRPEEAAALKAEAEQILRDYKDLFGLKPSG